MSDPGYTFDEANARTLANLARQAGAAGGVSLVPPMVQGPDAAAAGGGLSFFYRVSTGYPANPQIDGSDYPYSPFGPPVTSIPVQPGKRIRGFAHATVWHTTTDNNDLVVSYWTDLGPINGAITQVGPPGGIFFNSPGYWNSNSPPDLTAKRTFSVTVPILALNQTGATRYIDFTMKSYFGSSPSSVLIAYNAIYKVE